MVEIGKEPIPVETAALRYARGNLRKHEQGPAGSSRVEKHAPLMILIHFGQLTI